MEYSNWFYLMNKDKPLTKFRFQDPDTPVAKISCEDKKTELALSNWISGRSAVRYRKRIEEMLNSVGCADQYSFVRITKCLSLNDSLWIKEETDSSVWETVNLYYNHFSDIVARTAFTEGVFDSSKVAVTSPEWTTSGQFGKCWVRRDGVVKLVKRGNDMATTAPYNEVLASQVFKVLNDASVNYSLVYENGVPASICDLFTTEDVGFVSYGDLMGKLGVSFTLYDALSIYDKFGYGDMFRAMIVGDCITLNIDRHAGNFGWYVTNEDFMPRTMAPIFDFNLTFLPQYPIDKMIRNVDSAKPDIGSNWVDTARYVLTDSLKHKLHDLYHTMILVSTDDVFTEERLKAVNAIKNYQIDRILGRKSYY